MSKKKEKKVKKKGYVFLNNIPFLPRILIILALIAAGVVLQFYAKYFLAGFLVIFCGSLLAYRRSYKSPVKLKGAYEPEWEAVTLEEWEKIENLHKKSTRAKSSIANISSGSGMFMMITIFIVFGIVFSMLADEDENFLWLFIFDVGIIYIPVFFSGTISTWQPSGLDVKLKAFRNVYEHFSKNKSKELELRPMLGLATGDQDGKHGRVPVDVKLMIRFPEQPKNFYGVQVQCSLNNVKGTNYPYLYTVVLTAPDFPINKRKPPEPVGKDLDYEPSQSAEAVVLVVRQHTTRTSGYHTNERRQIEIVESAIDLAERILKAAA